MKTFIKWSGNKSRYLKAIIPLIPREIETYIEPFVGSGAVFLKTQPKKWIINDLNTQLIAVWKSLKSPRRFKTLLKGIKGLGKRHTKYTKAESLKYYRRLTTNGKFESIKPATYLVLKNLVYMGILLRGNKPYFRGFDMSFHLQTVPHVYSAKFADNLAVASKFLQETKGQVLNGDYKKVLARAKRNDFCFLDPPYIEEHKYDFQYNLGERQLEEGFLEELKQEVTKLDKRGVRWMMTQADTKEVRQTFKAYKIVSFRVYRHKTKQYKNELLIRNYT
jgi:DNA adenine methylase